MKFFISDLDKTLIYSATKEFLENHPEVKCAEKYQNREITFMTDESFKLLDKVFKYCMFIPCTMRSLSQTTRIDFIKAYNPKYMICTNGAEIYINGELDEDWNEEMKKLVTREEILSLQEKVDDLNLDLVENRNVNDFYIALKFKTTHLDEELKKLKEIVPKNYNIQHDGIKVFLLNKLIDKSQAIIYLIEKEKLKGEFFIAGDSNADAKMCNLTFSKNFIPKHATFESSNAYRTVNEKFEATEEILREILRECYKNSICYVAELDQDVDDFVAVKYLQKENVLRCVVLDPYPKTEEGLNRIKELKNLGIEVLNKMPNSAKIVFCGGALSLISNYIQTRKIDLLVMNGGFVGSNLITKENQLKKFENKEIVRTFNFNIDVNATDKVLKSKNIKKIILVGKNVCHSKFNTSEYLWKYEDCVKGINKEKRQHDLLACHEGLAFLGIKEHYCQFMLVKPFNNGLNGNMTKWGSTIGESQYRTVVSAVNFL